MTNKLRPTNNDAGSHAVKLQVDKAVVVKTVSNSVRSARTFVTMCMENADPSRWVNTNEYSPGSAR